MDFAGGLQLVGGLELEFFGGFFREAMGFFSIFGWIFFSSWPLVGNEGINLYIGIVGMHPHSLLRASLFLRIHLFFFFGGGSFQV